jgi:DNA adenine methylase
MLKYILPLLPPPSMCNVYNEPFFGGGSVFWALPEKYEVETINDKWDIAINFYEVLRSDFKELKRYIDGSLVSRSHHKHAQRILQMKRAGCPVDKVQLAWAFWMCANFSFANKVMYGGIKYSNVQNSSVPEQMRNKKDRFTEWLADRLQDVYIECNDALIVIESRNDKSAIHYLDPPYPGADQGHYAGYGWEEYERLLKKCEQIKGMFVLSNYNSPLLDHYIEKNGWFKKEVDKHISAPKVKERRKKEVLVLNYTPTNFKATLF